MQYKTYKRLKRIALFMGAVFIFIPPFLFRSNPNPGAGFIGCYGIPIKGFEKGGYPLYLFWIDFAIAAGACLLTALFCHCKAKAK